MALTIGLSSSGSVQEADYSAGLSLEDDGYYWFLHPYFEQVWRHTGQMVDPYGNAVFTPNSLPILRAALGDALQALDEQPVEWKVRVGWREDGEVLASVTQVVIRQLLAGFIALTDTASQTGTSVVCYGD